MPEYFSSLMLIALLAPLLGAAIAGIAGKWVGRAGAHWVTIVGVAIAFAASIWMLGPLFLHDTPSVTHVFYSWAVSANLDFHVGFLFDRLTAVMMVTVTFVSLLVHIYSIGYMVDDPGYQRFFSYMSLFTFFMLTLVVADNFLLLFFGWEGVGLVSYLLIGFWFQREAAAKGSLKAFLVNRVGDLGFLLGIAGIFAYFGTIDYAPVFAKAPQLVNTTIAITAHWQCSVLTLICLLLFIGAMGKSAQVPLHVWLPESMEGPTPISALIHAATMVTAGVYMVARLSPLFELSQVALSTVLVVGATGALFMGILALVQNDIKRVIAYSTMSQLGYMMAANGVSAFSAGIFHLMTHACFKALLFLAAGSVIIALHHEQDMRKMGNLRKYLPITYLTFFIGALALAAVPPFSGFYSKDAIIEVVQHANIPGASYAYWCLLLGAFVTALYIFRALFLTFHTQERMSQDQMDHIHEPALVVLLPLILLAIPSMLLGAILAGPMLYNEHFLLLRNSIYVAPQFNFLHQVAADYHGLFYSIIDSVYHLQLWVSLAGIFVAWILYVKLPSLPQLLRQRFSFIYWVLVNKYGFDAFNQLIFVRGVRSLSRYFYQVADVKFIDGFLVDGSGHVITRMSALVRRLQSGYLYQYALFMVVGLFGFLVWFLV